MAKMIPLISSGTAGPLGVLHLPRLWLKVSLDATGQLDDDYPAIGDGYDAMVLNALGIDKEVFSAFVKEQKPTYPETESWILEQSGGSLDQNAMAELNAAITGYNHADDVREEILAASGIGDDGSIPDAVNLNNLDDWHCFHQAALS